MADTILQKNKDYAEKLKTVLRLRYEPVAVKHIDCIFLTQKAAFGERAIGEI